MARARSSMGRAAYLRMVFAVAALLPAGRAEASTWYVRPEAPKGTYGKENGSSYNNAFNGLTIGDRDSGGLKWGTGGIKAGDILYVCGNHWLSITKPSDSFFHGRIAIGANGTSSAPITIRCDGSDPGIIWGFGRNTTLSDKWTGPDSNGVYKIDRDLGRYLAQDVTLGVKGAVYITSMPTTTWTGNYGAFCLRDGKTYVKTTDGKSPAGRIYTGDIAYRFALLRNQYITFKGCNFPGFLMDVDRDENGELLPAAPRSKYITFENCKFRYGSQSFFRLYDDNNYWLFKNCTFEWCIDAINTIGGTGSWPGCSYMTVTGCAFKHLGTGIYPHQDAHGIGIRRGVGHVIEHNTFEDTGSAIEFWTSVGNPMRNMTTRYNFIKDVKKKVRTEGSGIVISGDNPATGTTTIGQRTGFKIYGNIVVGAQGSGFSSNNEDPVLVYNNIFVNCGSGVRFEMLHAPVQATFKNNIIYNPTQLFIICCGFGTPTLDWDYNIYYSAAGNQTSLWRPYGSFAGWKEEIGCVVDAHSRLTDPRLPRSSPTQDTECKPQAGSCAIDTGVNMGLALDYLGKTVPQGKSPDIGAFEDAAKSNNSEGWAGYE
ncbi:MAG: right-handed parallel beta-helix repeat-containing protein [Candidatus Sumerlaeia bacterium]